MTTNSNKRNWDVSASQFRVKQTVEFNSSYSRMWVKRELHHASLVNVARGDVYHVLEERSLTYSIVT